jgi:hypothetical protein
MWYAADAAAITPMVAMRPNAMTRRRLGDGEGSGAASASTGTVALSCDMASSDAPHLWHSDMSRLLTAEHDGHSASCRSAAHSLQYFAAGGLPWPQNEQRVRAIAVGPSAVSNSTIELRASLMQSISTVRSTRHVMPGIEHRRLTVERESTPEKFADMRRPIRADSGT